MRRARAPAAERCARVQAEGRRCAPACFSNSVGDISRCGTPAARARAAHVAQAHTHTCTRPPRLRAPLPALATGLCCRLKQNGMSTVQRVCRRGNAYFVCQHSDLMKQACGTSFSAFGTQLALCIAQHSSAPASGAGHVLRLGVSALAYCHTHALHTVPAAAAAQRQAAAASKRAPPNNALRTWSRQVAARPGEQRRPGRGGAPGAPERSARGRYCR